MISQTIWCLHKLNLCIHVSASQSINTFLNKQRHFKEHSTNFTVKKHLKWNISCDTPYDYYSIKLEKWNMLIRKLSAWYDNVPASDEVSMSPNVPPPLPTCHLDWIQQNIRPFSPNNQLNRQGWPENLGGEFVALCVLFHKFCLGFLFRRYSIFICLFIYDFSVFTSTLTLVSSLKFHT